MPRPCRLLLRGLAAGRPRASSRSTAAVATSWLLLVVAAAPVRAAFVDVTPAPLSIPSGASGAAWNDFDGDGDPDLAVAVFRGSVMTGCRLFRNDGGGFVEVTSLLTGASVDSLGIGVSWGDSDDDGDLDLFVGQTERTGVLYRNDGSQFVRRSLGDLGGAFTSGRTVLWVDFDGDGDLDVYRTGSFVGSSRLFRNDGGDVFRNVTPAALQIGELQTAAWADYDNDGDPDLYAPVQGGAAVLARNDGGGSFQNVAAAAGVNVTLNVLGVDWGDFDNDGFLDLYVGNIGGPDRLFRNQGNGTFADVTPAIAEATGAATNWADFDNDGDLDLYQGTYGPGTHLLLRNDGGGQWVDVASGPFTVSGQTVGSSWADFDGDGDVDLFLAGENEPSRLLRNDQPPGAHWLRVDLAGTISNRAGIGARITVVAGGRSQIREVSGGSHWLSQNSVPAEFGLGSATTITSLTVRWPSGIVQTVSGAGVDRRITVTEPGFAPKPSLAGGFVPGAAIDFRLERLGLPVTHAELFYRAAGSGSAFTQATMTIGADSLAAAVPSGTASEHGVEYYLRYRLRGGTERLFPFEGPRAPAFLPANLGERAQPQVAGPSEYELFALPFTASPSSLAGVLEDDLGAYDPKRWRFGRFAPSAGAYLEGANAGAITPGRGFWLIQKEPVAVDARGVSTSTVGGTAVAVDPGWNQIGHPYLFAVATSAVDRTAAPDVVPRFVGRAGGAYVDVTTLQPWKGYWVFNGGTGTQTIVIPGQITPSPAPPARSGPEPWAWRIEVSARAGTSADVGNVAGAVHDDASRRALAEPPALPGTVRVCFLREDAGVREWTSDVRAFGRDGEAFDLEITSPEGGSGVAFDGLDSLPAGWGALLVSDAALAAIDLEPGSTLSLPGEAVHRFRLVVGTQEAIEAARAGRDVPLDVVRLAAPRPNPFADVTEFAFALPGVTKVELAIYDVSGRLVRRLVHGTRAAGIHRQAWDGRDSAGTIVGAGVYFAKLRTDREERTAKVVRVN